jgi:hypothetical protein
MSEQQQLDLGLTFGDSFLEHHAGNIIASPHYALVELVANCWDAGAGRVDIKWLENGGNQLSIKDDGTGMTYEEFSQRWTKLNYNRLKYQGSQVEFPKKSRKRNRVAFGRNGVGRHAMFCFADKYFVKTVKDGDFHLIKVERSFEGTPFRLNLEDSGREEGHGTTIFAEVTRNSDVIAQSEILELIGSRFVADPEFDIYVNNNHVSLEEIEHLCESTPVDTEHGKILIRRFDSKQTGRTSKQSGVAWWVNRRLVGEPSWETNSGPLLDARTAIGKRFTYVVEADQLLDQIKQDWSGFYSSPVVNGLSRLVSEFIRKDLRALLYDTRKDNKREALNANKDKVRRLPLISQKQISDFLEEIQILSPTMQQRDLNNTVQVLANLEKARSGYSLLEQLSLLSENDLDELEAVLGEWNISDAKKILDELRYRLELIERLDGLIENHDADELHDLQPLFEIGLWIFGPEFESISFRSNRSLATVMKHFFGETCLEHPRKRPDFVILSDSSIGIYACDDFDENHEVSGFKSIVIVELKRGGFKITDEEKNQARKYARELRRSGKVHKDTRIICYVLGTSIEPLDQEVATDGETYIYPRTYNSVLRQAKARTFHLLEKIESVKKMSYSEELAEIFEVNQGELFSDDLNPNKELRIDQNFSPA